MNAIYLDLMHCIPQYLQTRKLRLAIEQGREEQVVIKNYRRDGTSYWSRVQIGPMRDLAGKITLIVGVQCEVREVSK